MRRRRRLRLTPRRRLLDDHQHHNDHCDTTASIIASSTTTTAASSSSSSIVMNGSPTNVSAGSESRTPSAGNHHQHHHHNNNNTTTNNNHSHHVHHQQQQNLSKTNLYIRGLQNNTSDQDLYNMCSRFGPILSTKAIMDKATGTCKGYGFVEFTLAQTAELAVQELTNSGIQAQMAKISPLYSSNHHHNYNHNNNHNNNNNHHHGNNNINSGSSHHPAGINNAMSHTSNSNVNQNQQQHYQGSNSNADPTNLYIANLPPNMSEQELEGLLSKYGSVVSTRMLRDQSNNTRGVGFARMDSRDKCEQIIEQLNGRTFKGWKEPLLVKFADGGNKKRPHQHNNHHHLHHNSSHHQHHKAHQDDGRWQDNGSGNNSGPGNSSSFEHQSNIAHSNRLSDLTMMSTMSYPRMQPGFPPTVAPGNPYHNPLGPQPSPPQWIHHGGPGQPPFVISQQMIQPGGIGPSNQAAALHYGHIPQLTSQMQGLQITHPGATVGAGYLPQHQWSTLWAHPIPQQAQPSMRLPAHHMQPQTQQSAPQQHQQNQHQQPQTQLSPQSTPDQSQQQPNPPQTAPVNDNSSNKLQVSIPL